MPMLRDAPDDYLTYFILIVETHVIKSAHTLYCFFILSIFPNRCHSPERLWKYTGQNSKQIGYTPNV